MSNMKTKSMTISALVGKASFNQGFQEARRGRKLTQHRIDNPDDNCWGYERGRQFALACPEITKIKRGNKVLHDAAYAFSQAWKRKEII